MPQLMQDQPLHGVFFLPVQFHDLFDPEKHRGPSPDLCDPSRPAAQSEIQHKIGVDRPAESFKHGLFQTVGKRVEGSDGRLPLVRIVRDGVQHRQIIVLPGTARLQTGAHIVQTQLFRSGDRGVHIRLPAFHPKAVRSKGRKHTVRCVDDLHLCPSPRAICPRSLYHAPPEQANGKLAGRRRRD